MIGVEEHEQGVEDKNEGDFTTKIDWRELQRLQEGDEMKASKSMAKTKKEIPIRYNSEIYYHTLL
eukprot:scaffold4637_cov144-Skeletonema_menzelii.AAC.4